MMFYGEFDFHVTGGGTDEDFSDHLDEVLVSLCADARVIDPDYGASLAARTVSFTFSIEADNLDAASETFSGALRAAIHAADGHTPTWTAEAIKKMVEAVTDLVPC